jgi:hypothetical protein
MSERIYISLLVYDYETSPRLHNLRHFCVVPSEARRILRRLRKLYNDNPLTNRTGKWLERNHRISGFIERFDGIYREVTTQLTERP